MPIFDFVYVSQPPSSMKPFNAVCRLSVMGNLTIPAGSPELQIKTFTFPDALMVVDGWFYNNFVFSLRRHSPPAPARAKGEYIADWQVSSNGRHSCGPHANYVVTLFAGSTPIIGLNLGNQMVPPFSVQQRVPATLVPDNPAWPTGFPAELFNLIDSARLDMISEQDSN